MALSDPFSSFRFAMVIVRFERLIQWLMKLFLTGFFASERSSFVQRFGSEAMKVFHCFETRVQLLSVLVEYSTMLQLLHTWNVNVHYLPEAEMSKNHLNELDWQLCERISSSWRCG